MRAAVIDPQTNIVANIIVADAKVDLPPEGYFLVDVTDIPCGIGWIYDPQTGSFTDPSPSAEPIPAPLDEVV